VKEPSKKQEPPGKNGLKEFTAIPIKYSFQFLSSSLKFSILTDNYFKNRILNIHPALLPKFGGKGILLASPFIKQRLF
jgi:methionyl-tRNA formyltransferase